MHYMRRVRVCVSLCVILPLHVGWQNHSFHYSTTKLYPSPVFVARVDHRLCHTDVAIGTLNNYSLLLGTGL